MQWSDIPWDPPRRALRQFAGLWIGFFGLLAAWQGLLEGNSLWAGTLAALALSIGPLGLIRPSLVRPVFVLWIVLVFPLGWLLSKGLLACVYYGLFTPFAIVFRLVGRDRLARRRNPQASSYWAEKPMSIEPSSYFRQF